MDIEIGEVSSEISAIDLRAIKAELIADILRRLAEDRRLSERLEADRRVRHGALDRPEDLI
jgi:hypothetical protein